MPVMDGFEMKSSLEMAKCSKIVAVVLSDMVQLG